MSNNISEDWVCGIAHSPRLEKDNLIENRCEAFISGKARHFVELNESCGIITVY